MASGPLSALHKDCTYRPSLRLFSCEQYKNRVSDLQGLLEFFIVTANFSRSMIQIRDLVFQGSFT